MRVKWTKKIIKSLELSCRGNGITFAFLYPVAITAGAIFSPSQHKELIRIIIEKTKFTHL